MRLFIFLVLIFLSLSGCKKKSVPLALPLLSKDTFALVFTSSLEGYVAPCGCTSNPLGGIDRFAQVFLDIKKATDDRIALIDTGNLLFESSSRHQADLCQDNARIELLLSTLSDLGLKNTVLSTNDDARGKIYREKIYEKHNLNTLEPLSNYIIKAHNYNIAVINTGKSNSREHITNLISKIKKQKNIKFIVALSELEREENQKIFDNMPFVNIVIQGSIDATTPTTPSSPLKLGEKGPFLIQGARQGQFLTVLFLQNLSQGQSSESGLELDSRNSTLTVQIELNNERLNALKAQQEKASPARQKFLAERIKLATKEQEKLEQQKKQITKPLNSAHFIFEAIALTKKIEALKSIKSKLENYEKNIPNLVAQCEAAIQCPSADPKSPSYVGVQSCKACHMQAYEVWQKAISTGTSLDEHGKVFSRTIGHSKAWATLKNMNKDSDRNCIGCHSIGFMKPGGYCKASEVDFRKDVQCESCHGPGSLHAQSGDKKFINRKVSEETCRGCHHVPHIASYESFNYDRDVMKILGPGHGENLLKELKHKAKQ